MTDQERVLKFFDGILIPYVVEDLKVLMQIELKPNRLGGCAIPIAMTVISTMDLLGFLMSDKANIGDSEKNIGAIICNNNYFPTEYCKEIKRLAVDYRHGMMHSFFPSKKTLPQTPGVKRSKSNQLIEIDNINGVPYESINVDRIANDLLKAITKIRSEVGQDSNLVMNISKGIRILDFDMFSNAVAPTTMAPVQLTNKK